jgi:hypothetical protein
VPVVMDIMVVYWVWTISTSMPNKKRHHITQHQEKSVCRRKVSAQGHHQKKGVGQSLKSVRLTEDLIG